MIDSRPPRISVIVPVLNDAACLESLCARLKTLSHIHEIIVADGGSEDDLGAVVTKWRLVLVSAPKGRGTQMNRGAQIAQGEILWFLHADTLPSMNSTLEILKALEKGSTVGGAFRFRLSAKRWYGPLFEFFIRLRSSWFLLPYGDQGYFVRRSVFEQVEGYPCISILEDVHFLRRMKTVGRVKMLNTPIEISPRRWDREGVINRTWFNAILMVGYLLGIAPDRLAHLYPPEPHDGGRTPC